MLPCISGAQVKTTTTTTQKRNETIRRRRRDETRLHIFVFCVWFACTICMHTCDNDQADKRNGL